MKITRLLQLLALGGLILALGVMPALGDTLTMNQSNSLTIGLTGDANLTYVGFDEGYTYAFAQGSSTSGGATVGPISQTGVGTANASGAYFTTTATNTGYASGTRPYVLSQTWSWPRRQTSGHFPSDHQPYLFNLPGGRHRRCSHDHPHRRPYPTLRPLGFHVDCPSCGFHVLQSGSLFRY